MIICKLLGHYFMAMEDDRYSPIVCRRCGLIVLPLQSLKEFRTAHRLPGE